MESSLKNFKRSLANVFDDDFNTKQWHNVVDVVIIGFIVLSTVEVMLSTVESISLKYGKILNFINIFTTIVFTIEVSLRIWCADLISPKYKGVFGRVRYIFTFNAFIDFIATYPFYLSLFFPIPYTAMKVLRLMRLLRIFRYIPAFNLLVEAVKSRKRELTVSMQFVFILTLILSLFFYIFEHNAQPDVCDNILTAFIWPFAKYFGEAGSWVTMEPITTVGKAISFAIGTLSIAIVAIPTGLLGSAFIDVMDEKEKEKTLAQNIEKIKKSFRHVQCRYTKLLHTPQFITLGNLRVKTCLTETEIVEAIKASNEFRIQNLAVTRLVDENPADKLIVEHFFVNRPYGGFLDRNSNVTIVSTSSAQEPGIGHFSYYLAKMGGFNFVSREIIQTAEKPISYYNISPTPDEENQQFFLDDLQKLATKENAVVIFLLSASGGEEPNYPTQFHYIVGAEKGDENYKSKDLTISDVARFDEFFRSTSAEIEAKFSFLSDLQRFHAGNSEKNIGQKIHKISGAECFTIRIAWDVTVWDYRSFSVSKTLADKIFAAFSADKTAPDLSELLSQNRKIGEDFGFGFYEEV